MDPLTAALQLANTIAQIVLITIQSMPEEQRAEYSKLQMEGLKQWQDFLNKFQPKPQA